MKISYNILLAVSFHTEKLLTTGSSMAVAMTFVKPLKEGRKYSSTRKVDKYRKDFIQLKHFFVRPLDLASRLLLSNRETQHCCMARDTAVGAGALSQFAGSSIWMNLPSGASTHEKPLTRALLELLHVWRLPPGAVRSF